MAARECSDPAASPAERTPSPPPLAVLCGPTAAGKTVVALALAGDVDLVIVSADSRQIYRGFDIGTAKPTPAERRRVPHVGIDVVDPTARYTAYAWAAEARTAIAAARQAGRTPLVVGGAGFYVRALVHPVTEAAPAGEARYQARYLVVDPGASLPGRIADRLDAMLRAGWVDEVADLAGRTPDDAPAWQASGYAELRDHVRGRTALGAARERALVATRQYAKRQRTWFRHQLPAARVTHLDPDEPGAVRAALRWLRDPAPAPDDMRAAEAAAL